VNGEASEVGVVDGAVGGKEEVRQRQVAQHVEVDRISTQSHQSIDRDSIKRAKRDKVALFAPLGYLPI
jgi:hypothetical protein